MRNERQALTWFGVLDFIEKNGGHQHRIHLLLVRCPQDHGLELLELRQGVAANRAQSVHALGEQLCKAVLRAVNAEATLKLTQLFSCEPK